MFHFNCNCDNTRCGKCLVQNHIINDNELYLIDDISVNIDNNENVYKNDINDNYFN